MATTIKPVAETTPARVPSASKPKRRLWFERVGTPYLLLLPALLLVLFFQLYPTFMAGWYSFQNVVLAKLSQPKYVGLSNFVQLFTGPFPNLINPIALVTVYWVIGAVILQVGTGLGLALLLQQPWLKGRDFFRGLFLFPWVIAGIIVGYSWRFIFEPNAGLANAALRSIGLSPVSWLNLPLLAMPALLIASTWRAAGYSLVLEMGGLQSVPEEVYDAAAIDGASGLSLLWYIIVPVIKPFLLVDMIVATVGALGAFDFVLTMTRGGPVFRTEIVGLFSYHQAFIYGKIGYGAAISVIVYLVSIVLTICYLFLFRGDEEAF
jgi:ABC-type sugar transport system permease subunit